MEWISVDDRLPEKEGKYQFKIDGKEALDNGHWSDRDLYDPKFGFQYDWYTTPATRVTHWKPNKE